MSGWRREKIEGVVPFVDIGISGAVGVVGGLGVLIGLVNILSDVVGVLLSDFVGVLLVNVLSDVIGVLSGVLLGVIAWGLRRGSQIPTGVRAVPPLGSRSLRWVRGLLPGDEGTVWWGEVTSCLAETPDKGERRRYVRSYRCGVPRLIWTSWSEHLSGSRQRELL